MLEEQWEAGSFPFFYFIPHLHFSLLLLSLQRLPTGVSDISQDRSPTPSQLQGHFQMMPTILSRVQIIYNR